MYKNMCIYIHIYIYIYIYIYLYIYICVCVCVCVCIYICEYHNLVGRPKAQFGRWTKTGFKVNPGPCSNLKHDYAATTEKI